MRSPFQQTRALFKYMLLGSFFPFMLSLACDAVDSPLEAPIAYTINALQQRIYFIDLAQGTHVATAKFETCWLQREENVMTRSVNNLIYGVGLAETGPFGAGCFFWIDLAHPSAINFKTIEGYDTQGVVVSPDNGTLFTLGTEIPLSEPVSPWFLLEIDVTTGNILKRIPLTSNAERNLPEFLSLSPDGRWAAVTASYAEAQGYSLVARPDLDQAVFIIDLVKGTMVGESLVAPLLSAPTFSSDSQHLLLHNFQNQEVYQLAVSTLEPKIILTPPSGPTRFYSANLLPIPKKDQILYYHPLKGDKIGIEVFNASGNVVREHVLDLTANYAAFSDDTTLCFRVYDHTYPEGYHSGPPSGRTKAEHFIFVNTGTWEITRTQKIELPEEAFGKALFFVAHS